MISTEDHLPKPYEWYEHQIAGHHPSVIKNGLRQIGIIKVPNTPVLLKVIQDDGRGSCEQQLYQDVKEAYENENVEGCVRALCKLHDLIPRYYGIHTIKIGKFHYQFMELEDISSTYCMPMVMDVKIGRVSYDPNATAEKRISEIKKCPFQIESGFRILGYRLSNKDPSKVKEKDREWGRNRCKENIDDAFSEYLSGRPNEFEKVTTEFLHRLQKVKNYFYGQDSLQFYASSLLFIYEGDTTKKTAADIKMIDFSHVFREPDTRDENYLAGIVYICDIFKKLLNGNSINSHFAA